MAELVTYAYIRSETGMSQNIPDDELQTPLKRSQDMLKMLLGTLFYEEIDGQFPNLSTNNNALFDPYVKQFLAWQSYQFWLPKANFKTTRSGIRVHTEENSQPANSQEMATLYRDAKEQAQFYKENVIGYISKRRFNDNDIYPLYEGCRSNVSGNGFHITSVSKGNNILSRINKRIDFNG